MAFTQQLCDRRDGLRRCGRKFVEIYLFPGPARPHRRGRSYHAGIRKKPAQRIGLPAFRDARVEQEIVKVPEDEMIVALGRSQAFTAAGVDPEKDLAIQQQGEKLDPWKAVLSSELLDLPRRRQQGEGGCNLRVANPEQRTG